MKHERDENGVERWSVTDEGYEAGFVVMDSAELLGLKLDRSPKPA